MYTFFTRSRLILIFHSTSSSADTQLRCEFCPKLFDTRRKRRYVSCLQQSRKYLSLIHCRNHVLSVHEKRFVCRVPRCPLHGQPFGFRADLRRHQQSTHPEGHQQPKLPCPITGCKAMLPRRKDNARRHLMKTHGLDGNTADVSLSGWSAR
jgi:hypothetical protein